MQRSRQRNGNFKLPAIQAMARERKAEFGGWAGEEVFNGEQKMVGGRVSCDPRELRQCRYSGVPSDPPRSANSTLPLHANHAPDFGWAN
jgi:hypothetical protein